MVKSKAIIVDIDGTIADGSHRQHWLKNKPKNWDAYNAGMGLDKPILPVIEIISVLSLIYPIIICSGRQDKDRKITEAWLEQHGIPYKELCMRPTGDYADDTVIKERMYHRLKEEYDILAVFDDRKKVKRKWVDLGVFVFDVNQHDLEF